MVTRCNWKGISEERKRPAPIIRRSMSTLGGREKPDRSSGPLIESYLFQCVRAWVLDHIVIWGATADIPTTSVLLLWCPACDQESKWTSVGPPGDSRPSPRLLFEVERRYRIRVSVMTTCPHSWYWLLLEDFVMKVFFFSFFLYSFSPPSSLLSQTWPPFWSRLIACVCVCLYSRRKSSESRTDRCCCLPQSADVKATAPYVHTQDQIDTDGRANF